MVNRKENDRNRPGRVEEVIDLAALFLYLLRYWYLILIFLLAGSFALGFIEHQRPYTYTSNASIFIQSESTVITSIADVQLGNALSNDFIELATCKPVLDTVITTVETETGTTLTRKEVKDAVSIYNTKDTRLLNFVVTTLDPVLSKCIAQAFADATARQVSAIMKTDEPTRVEMAETEIPDAKNFVKHAAMGGIAGACIPGFILVILFLMNDRIETEEDVRQYLDTNVIGKISIDDSKSYRKKDKKSRSVRTNRSSSSR